MKQLFCLFVATFFCCGVHAAALLYSLEFEDPIIKSQVKKCPEAKVEKDFEGISVLTVKVASGQGKDVRSGVYIPINFTKIGASAKRITAEFDIQYIDVTEPKREYNGVKCMLQFDYDGKTRYPDFYIPRPKMNKRFGTIPWTRRTGEINIPEGVKHGVLFLGLQDASGEISFKNFRIYDSGNAPKSTLLLNPVPQAKYTVPYQPKRGVMSPLIFKEEDFKELQKWGANLIRWQLAARVSPYNLEKWKEAIHKKVDDLQKVLDAGEKYGISVAIDLHTTAGRQILETPEGNQFFIDIWKKIATRYKGHPAIYGYDLANEPHSCYLKPGSPSWLELAEQAIKEIRTIDPVTPIIVSSDSMGSPATLEFLPVFPYDNIIYTIHMYHPGDLTHQLDPNKTPFVGYPNETMNKQNTIVDFLAIVRKFQLKTGARIFVGEFGCIRWAPGADQYLKDCTDVFEEYSWDWSYHAFREWQGWSVEHSDDPQLMTPVPTTKRKEVLINAFKRTL